MNERLLLFIWINKNVYSVGTLGDSFAEEGLIDEMSLVMASYIAGDEGKHYFQIIYVKSN